MWERPRPRLARIRLILDPNAVRLGDDRRDRVRLLTPPRPGKDASCRTRRRLRMHPDARPRRCPRWRARQGRLAWKGRLTRRPEPVLVLRPLDIHARHQEVVVVLPPPLSAPRLEFGSH